MEKLFKQLEGLVTEWKTNNKPDDFFIARLKLTFYYSITAMVILGGSSIVLYNTILSNLAQSISENIFFLDPRVAESIIDKARDILLNRFITIDSIIILFVIVFGFLLTHKTLEPIESNMQRQKRFIADASHELRTPISVVISGLEVSLNNKNLDLSGAKQALGNTLEEMREFSKLSKSLLDISTYNAPIKVKQEKVDINETINSVVEKNKSLANVKNINIENRLANKPKVIGNKIELERVFFNILDNAIKYTPPSGIITLEDKIISGKYVVTISDTGVGIPEGVIDKVFDPFFRANVSHSTEGAGLGLTLSKQIIENHKGTISIKSQAKKGTQVIIALPIPSQ